MPPSEHELRLRERLGRLRNLPLLGGARLSGELERLQRQIERIGEESTDEEIWRKVELARHDDRPYTLDYVERMLDDWFELHGDRALGDDGADRGVRERRGRLGRGDRDRARRPRPHAGERDLLRHLARGLRRDPLARRGPGEEGRGRIPTRRGALPRARRDRRDRLGTGR